MKKVLIVVDMQNDFVDGSLGTKEAVGIVENVVSKIQKYKDGNYPIIVTQDTHYNNYFDTVEGKNLPIKHCIANTDGWQINDNVYEQLKNYQNVSYILKHTFGSLEMVNILKNIISNDENEQKEHMIEIIGLYLDICVISNAVLIKNFFPETNVYIDMECTVATSKTMYDNVKLLLKGLQIGETCE